MEKKFKIDFFELMFLAEACLPPTPIARAMFWESMVDEYYHQMNSEQRRRVFDWINRNPYYEERLKEKNEAVLLFQNRYDPKNQYNVFYKFGQEKGEAEAFLHEGEYRTSKRKFINPDYITKVEKRPY